MQCAISGVAPVEPVVSVKTGHVFERRLIEKHLETAGTCPVTGTDLSKEDLIAVKSGNVVRPRPPSASSIPSLISIMQSEWDALMLETYTLKTHLNTVRQELAQSLYRNDAASRVIAKLIQERDQARAALAQKGVPIDASASMQTDVSMGIPDNVITNMQETANLLSKARKKRVKTLAAEAATESKLQEYSLLSSQALHSSAKPGILAMDIHLVHDHLLATAGADGTAVVFNRTSGKVEDTLKAHKKRINDVKFHPTQDILATASQDNTVMIWGKSEDKYSVAHTFEQHQDEVVGVTFHPSGSYLVSASADASWNFYDTESGQLYQSVFDEKKSGYSSISFHPDGLILGCGTKDSFVRIFDVKVQKNVASFSEGHKGEITNLAFSENGYYLASADTVGQVKLWDLRKLANFKTIEASTLVVKGLSFDQSGSYLGVGSGNAQIYETKNFSLLKSFGDAQGEVTGVVFGKAASFVATASKDRNLRFYGSK